MTYWDIPTHDAQACHDQYVMAVRGFADMSVEMMDIFIKAGFVRVETFQLLIQFLDTQMVGVEAST